MRGRDTNTEGTTAPMGHRLMSLHSLPRSLNRQIHKKTRTSQMAKKHLTSNGSSQTLVSLMMPLVMFTMGLQTNRSTIDSSVVYLSAYFCFGIQIDRRNDWTIKLWGPVLLQIGGYKQYFLMILIPMMWPGVSTPSGASGHLEEVAALVSAELQLKHLHDHHGYQSGPPNNWEFFQLALVNYLLFLFCSLMFLYPLSRWVVGYIIKMWRPKTDDVMASAVVWKRPMDSC